MSSVLFVEVGVKEGFVAVYLSWSMSTYTVQLLKSHIKIRATGLQYSIIGLDGGFIGKLAVFFVKLTC